MIKAKAAVLALAGMIIMTSPGYGAFGGLRLGISLGAQKLAGRHFYTGTPSPASDMIKRLAVYSPVYGVHGGYLFELGSSKFVIGFDAYYLMTSTNAKINLALQDGPGEGTATIKHTKSIGFSGVLGLMLNPKILVYGNLGYESASFEFKYSLTVPGTVSPQNQRKMFNGISVGLGGSYKVAQHILLGAEFSNPFFKKFSGTNNTIRNYRYKPVERRLLFKISYLL